MSAGAGTPGVGVNVHAPKVGLDVHAPKAGIDVHAPKVGLDVHAPNAGLDVHGLNRGSVELKAPQVELEGPQVGFGLQAPQGGLGLQGLQVGVGADVTAPQVELGVGAAGEVPDAGLNIRPRSGAIKLQGIELAATKRRSKVIDVGDGAGLKLDVPDAGAGLNIHVLALCSELHSIFIKIIFLRFSK